MCKKPTGFKLALSLSLLLCMDALVFAQGPVVSFTASTTRGCSVLRVRFTDNSTGNPTGWRWQFGTLGTSTQQNPTFDFPNPGKYTITLTAANASGNNTLTRTDYIEVLARPVAEFTANNTGGCVPLLTQFTDSSKPGSGTIVTRLWNFEDGSTSGLTNPQKTFNNPGDYSISLKVTNNSGCSDSIVKPHFIRASSPISAAFRNTQAATCRTPETISFTNLSSGIAPLFFEWHFGDGDTSQQTNPAHAYTTGGSYTVKLVVRNPVGCRDSVTVTRAVTINNIQTAFSGPDSVCAGNAVVFQNTSSSPVATASWFTGNTLVSSNTSSATFSWNNPGVYPVSFFAGYPGCFDSFSRTIRVLGLPTSGFTATNLAACQGPLNTVFNNTSSGGIRWLWDFGDGTTDSSRNPLHTYTNQGSYSVSLTTINANGCQRKFTQSNLITIKKPFVRIANLPAEGCVPFTIRAVPGISSVDGLDSVIWKDGLGNSYRGLNPPPFTYSNPGNYTVKLFATTTGGCTDSAVVTNGIRVGTKPTANFSADRMTQCVFQPVVFTNLSTTSDTWWWLFRDTTIRTRNASYSARDTGSYTVTLIAGNNGCKDTLTRNNHIRSLPPIARFRPVIDCNNQLQVSFIDSSVMPQTWNWNFGDGTTATDRNPMHRFNTLGEFTVSLTSGNGACTHTDSARVRLLVVNPDFTSNDTLACKFQALRFSATNLDSSVIKNYHWDFGDGIFQNSNSGTVTHDFRNSGRYSITLTVTDINNCTYSITKSGLIKINGPKAGFTTTPRTGCAPLLISFSDASLSDGSNNLASWKWNYGNGQSQIFNTPPAGPLSYSYSDTGTFYPSLLITDQIGCIDSIRASDPIFVTKPKAGFINSNSNICANSNVQFSSVAKGTGLSHLWQFGDNSTSTAPNENKIYPVTGNYTVKLIVTDINGCKDSLERPDLVRVQNVQAAFEMSDSVTSCAPIDIYFTNTSLFSISQTWDFGDGTSSTLANPTHLYSQPGNYTVRLIARRTGDCISETTKQVRIFPSNSSLSVTSALIGCQPYTVQLKASTAGPVRYAWDFNDGTTVLSRDSIINHIYTETGSYLPVVRMRDSTGCILTARAPDSIRIVGSDIDFSSDRSLLCGTEPIQFRNTTRTPSGTQFKWQFGDGASSNSFSPSHQYTANGLYTITLTSISAFGCKDTLIRTDFVKVVTQPDIGINGSSGLCGSSLVTLSGRIIRSDSLPLTWDWNFDNGSVAGGQNPPQQLFSLPRTYQVRASVTNANGCTDTSYFPLTIHPIPVVDVIPDTVVCKGSSIVLRTTGAQTYVWQPAQNLSCSTCSNPVATANANTKYFVTGTSSDGCNHTDSIQLIVQQPFRIQTRRYDDTICVGETIEFNVTGADRYEWTPTDGLSNPQSNQPRANPEQTTRYRIIGKDIHNCFADTAYLPVMVYPYPLINAGDDRTVNPGTSFQLSTLFSSDVNQWTWTPADDLSCNRCPAPVVTPSFNRTYRITVANPGGCSASDEVEIRLSCDNSNLNLPNAFTPNNDGLNDVLYPKSNGIYSIQSFVIYNRNGEVVFRNGNFMPNVRSAGWNGMFKGMPAAAGTYVYEIVCICNNNNMLRFNGNITLIR